MPGRVDTGRQRANTEVDSEGTFMKITVAAIQLQASNSLDDNISQARQQVLSATSNGARVIVMPEIFSAPFVTGEVDLNYFSWAEPMMGPTNSMIAKIFKTRRQR